MKRILLFVFSLCFSTAFSQVVFNELTSRNASLTRDQFEKDRNFIELYNYGANDVNLKGYKIVRKKKKTAEFVFPEVILKSSERLLLFCGNGELKDVAEHLEVPFNSNDCFRFTSGDSASYRNWNLPQFNDSSWREGAGGIGYGDNDDQSVIPGSRKVLIRKTFEIKDPSQISFIKVVADYDDGFIAYINGVEVARRNIIRDAEGQFKPGSPREAVMFAGKAPEAIYVPGNVVKKALIKGDNVYAIEVYSSDLEDMSLVTNLVLGVASKEVTYRKVDESEAYLRTGFSLKGGEELVLYNSSGGVSDQIKVADLEPDHSQHRYPDGKGHWYVSTRPTPGKPNLKETYRGYLGTVSVKESSGIYDRPVSLHLSEGSDTALVRYTLDGSEPHDRSPIFRSGMSVKKTQVVKLRCFPSRSNRNNYLPGRSYTSSFLINEVVTMPVVAITGDPESLFDKQKGLLSVPPHDSFPYYSGNFWKGNRLPVFVEVIEPDTIASFKAYMKISGNVSRGFPQKSMLLQSSKDLGSRNIKAAVFRERENEKHHALHIRNGGTDWNHSKIRDALVSMALSSPSLEIQNYLPCLVYLNGIYWGIYEIREKGNDFYLADKYGIDRRSVSIVRGNGELIAGDDAEYFKLQAMVWRGAGIDSLKAMVDEKSLADLIIAGTYFSNLGWATDPSQTIAWKERNKGEWKYFLPDMDESTGKNGVGSEMELNMLSYINEHKADNIHFRIFFKLLEDREFKDYVFSRYVDLLNSDLSTRSLTELLNTFRSTLQPEMERHFKRFETDIKNEKAIKILDLSTWSASMDSIAEFVKQRPAYARQMIKETFNPGDEVSLNVKGLSKEEGFLKINNVSTRMASWNGIYFKDQVIKLKAVPAQGYRFSHFFLNDEKIITPETEIRLSVDSELRVEFIKE